MLDKPLLDRFNNERTLRSPKSICYAPFISMNFDQTGSITACCFNRSHVLGTYPTTSVKGAWSGTAMQELREALLEDRFDRGCEQCAKMLKEGNFKSVLIKHFDDHAGLSKALNPKKRIVNFFNQNETAGDDNLHPVMFEFELSNSCNLECIMCGGKWSSAIRKNREKLPPLKSPYDQEFVRQVREFLPNLKRANFLGGEPFLISVYYDLWEAIVEVNSDIEVAITSNGTILNSRSRAIIEKLNRCRITLSVDSIRKDTWEKIRLGGDFSEFWTNLNWLLETKKLSSFSVCPMVQNWKEIPELIQFCSSNDLDIYFNVVYGPLGGKVPGVHDQGVVPETSLQSLKSEELKKVVAYYQQFSFPAKWQAQLDALSSQLRSWIQQE